MGNIKHISNETEYMLSLLASMLCDKDEDALIATPPPDIDIRSLYELSKAHAVTAMVYCALKKAGQTTDILELFYEDFNRALMKESRQEIEAKEVFSKLSEKNILYMPLKGFILKRLYSKPYMRSSGDIDILVHEEDATEIKKLMLSLGFEASPHIGRHTHYRKRPIVDFEFHDMLLADIDMGDVWSRAFNLGNCEYRLDLNDEYIYLTAHAAKHFRAGGTGVRTFMDIYLYNKAHAPELDSKYIEERLNELGLNDFAIELKNAAEIMFDNAESSDYYDKFICDIIKNGVYGTSRGSMVHSVSAFKSNGLRQKKRKYIIARLFPKKEQMSRKYKVLKKAPFLLPFCYILRAFKAVFINTSKTRKEYTRLSSISEEELLKKKK